MEPAGRLRVSTGARPEHAVFLHPAASHQNRFCANPAIRPDLKHVGHKPALGNRDMQLIQPVIVIVDGNVFCQAWNVLLSRPSGAH